MRLLLNFLIWLFVLLRDVNSRSHPMGPIGLRVPPHSRAKYDNKKACGGWCVDPGGPYPIGREVGVKFYSRFKVPDLPKDHKRSGPYYDYLNIYWGKDPVGGYMNQFVPQLMLGEALANSTNAPDYHPQWIQLDSWHIGAQYFMGLCVKNESYPDGYECDQQTWISKAATGDLLPVDPGEIIETTFELVPVGMDQRLEWHLRIGVLDEPHRTSIVVADRPYMGLLNSTTSWEEELYEEVYVGSCLEDYEIYSSSQFTRNWDIVVDIWSTQEVEWRNWRSRPTNKCDWYAHSTLKTSQQQLCQRAIWNVTLDVIE